MNKPITKFDKVNQHYKNGFWSVNKVKEAVEIGWITPYQFKQITGEDYKN